MYVLDTDVLSITSPISGFQGAAADAWRHWVLLHQDELYLSVITIMEVRFGIESARGKGAVRKAAQLELWLMSAETLYRDRLIPLSIAIAQEAGVLMQRAVSQGAMPSCEDAIIAATADVHGFAVLSRNGRHMQALAARWYDPLQVLPGDGMT